MAKQKTDQPNEQLYRLFWDFYGPAAQQTAEHFARHLTQWFEREDELVNVVDQGVDQYSPNHSAVFCLIPERLSKSCISALKPRRGGPDQG